MRITTPANTTRAGIDMGKLVVIPRQVGTNADKDRRAKSGNDADLSMYNRYNAASSYTPRLTNGDLKRVEGIHTFTEVPTVYDKVK